MMKSKMEIYKEQAYTASKIDYSNKKTIAASNRAVDKMYKILRSLDEEEILVFCNLLDDDYAKKWIAHQLIEIKCTLPSDIVNKCFAIIEELANSNSIESYGERIWLNEWKVKMNQV